MTGQRYTIRGLRTRSQPFDCVGSSCTTHATPSHATHVDDAPVLETDRLRLLALSADALQAWIDADGAGLFELTGVRFPDPVEVPPLLGEDLPTLRERTAQGPEEIGWWVWLVSRLADEVPLGVCGLGGRPDEDGIVVLGYSVYPEHEGKGIATEAAGTLVAWALAQDGVAKVVATVPTWNLGSVAVVRKLGMVETGHTVDPEVGELAVYEMLRPI